MPVTGLSPHRQGGHGIPDSPPFPYFTDRVRALLLILALCAAPFSHWAAAQLRTIPANAQRAEMRHVQENVVELNGQRAQLAPGVQIRDASNRVIMPTALPSGSLVKYRLDANGHVREVWILTSEEAAN
jgi:hypothetical protein